MIKRFLRRFIETGAVFFLGLGGLLALGFLIAHDSPHAVIQSTSPRTGLAPTDSHEAAYVWLLGSIVCLILGIGTFFRTPEK